jgi:hypothetical protein
MRVMVEMMVLMVVLSPFSTGQICSREVKTTLGNVIGQRKNSSRKSWVSSYFLLFAERNSPSGKWALLMVVMVVLMMVVNGGINDGSEWWNFCN